MRTSSSVRMTLSLYLQLPQGESSTPVDYQHVSKTLSVSINTMTQLMAGVRHIILVLQAQTLYHQSSCNTMKPSGVPTCGLMPRSRRPLVSCASSWSKHCRLWSRLCRLAMQCGPSCCADVLLTQCDQGRSGSVGCCGRKDVRPRML